MNRRILALLIAFIMLFGLMTGCASGKQETAQTQPAVYETECIHDRRGEFEFLFHENVLLLVNWGKYD